MKDHTPTNPLKHGAVFVFSGFGSQWKTMGAGLMQTSPLFRQAIEECSKGFRQYSGWSIDEELLREKELSLIEDAHVAPFCIFALQSALVDLLKHRGITPSAVIGHSMGEISAAYCAGVLDMDDALRVIQDVNGLIDHARGKGYMAHVSLPAAEVQAIIQDLNLPLFIAAINSPLSTVVAGEDRPITELVRALEKKDVFFRILKNDAPLHTPLMGEEQEAGALPPITIRPPGIPIYSTLYGRRAETPDFTPEYWNVQARKPVLFTRALDSAVEDGYTTFIEIAPHPVLMGILEECFQKHPGRELFSAGTMKRGEDETMEFTRLLLALKKRGLHADFDRLSPLERETMDRIIAMEEPVKEIPPEQSPPRGAESLKALIREALAEVSQKKIVSISDESMGFFQMGLDSLMSIRLKDYLSASLHIPLSGMVSFEYPTIESLSRYLESKLAGREPRQHEVPGRKEGLHEPIAIIGTGCRFPGGAVNPEKFWDVLESGEDAVSEIPPDRWDKDLYYDPDPDTPGTMFTKSGGFLRDGVYDFDAGFFTISPREALAMDPQQRLLLEVCWEALEDAGIDAGTLKESSTGVYIGISCDDYEGAHRHSGDLSKIDAYSITGSTFSIVAGRISYLLGLQGPAFIVDTACSSTLVALHCACQSLRTGESDMAIVGGVNLILTPEVYICFTKLKALSPDGGCKTFDASANGYCRGEGCGVFVLKRLSDALKDNDRILAVVKGTALNQDGRSTGITAPNGLAQQKVIRMALKDAGITSSDVDYIEAHGTGTPLGDPIELEAIGAAMKERGTNKVYVGSVKSTIGHLESAAGTASLLKVILSLQHQALPPNLHFRNPSPHVQWDQLPLHIVKEMTPWPRGGRPRIAGISSFGFSGTNAHVILEEAPLAETVENLVERPCHSLALSAKNEKALISLMDLYCERLSGTGNDDLAHFCHTAATGRFHFESRAHAVGETADELISGLQALKETKPWIQPGDRNNQVVFLFSGQGSQHDGMARVLYETSPVFKEALDECDRIFIKYQGRSIIDIMHNGQGDESPLHQTMYTQPAIFSIEYALSRLWRSWGIEPAIVMGHSIGEYAAACTAGIFTVDEGLRLVTARGKLMQSLQNPGIMASIAVPEHEVIEAVRPFAAGVSIAAVNAPESVVISGEKVMVEAIMKEFSEKGRRVKILHVSHAFHSPLMESILDEFEHLASEITFRSPLIPLVSNLTGAVISPGEPVTPSYWKDHIRRTVRFLDSMKTLQAMGYRLFLELGGDSTLSTLGLQSLNDDRVLFIPSLKKGKDEWKTILGSLGSLYMRGLNVDWQQFDRPYRRRKVTLPTYPFQRKRYFMNPVLNPRGAGEEETALPGISHPFLGRKILSPALGDTALYQTVFSAEKPGFLQEHMMFGATVSPGAAHLSMMLSALAFHYKKGQGTLEEVSFLKPLVITENDKRTVQLILDPIEPGRDRARIASTGGSAGEWETHCTGIIAHGDGDTSRPVKTGLNLQELKDRCWNRIDTDDLYGRISKVGSVLGPRFRCIDELYYGDREFLGLVRKKKNNDRPGMYEIDPGLIDSILQVMLLSSAWAIRKVGEDESLFIPFHVGKFAVHTPMLPDEFWCHCKFREEQETVTGELAVFDEHGALYLEITDLIAKYTDRRVFLKGSRTGLQNVLYRENWVQQALGAPSSTGASPAQVFLLFEDRQGCGERLRGLLKQKGAHVIRVLPGESYQKNDDTSYTLTPSSRNDYTMMLRELTAPGRSREINGIIYLWPLDVHSGDSLKSEELEKEERFLCESVLNLVQALASLDIPALPKISAVTSMAQKVIDGEKSAAFAQAPLWGFGRTISRELPQVWGALIDIDEQVLADGGALVKEILHGGEETLVALRGEGRRYVARLEKETGLPAAEQYQFSPDSTYMITGGTGALGSMLAGWLIQKGCRHIAITGRDTSSPGRQEKLKNLETPGVQLLALEGDISSPGDTERMIACIKDSMPPLKGIFHLAGVLSDGMIEEQSWERFRNVLASKALGAWNLHCQTRNLELELFVMYSSASSLLGNPGQGNYAAANAFIDALASYRRGLGLPALSINWSSWSEAGMAAAGKAGHDRLAHYGVRHLKGEFALEVLDMLLSSHKPRACVLDIDWRLYRDRMEGKQSRYLSILLPDRAEESDPGDSRKEGIIAILSTTPPHGRKEALVRYLQSWSARIMGSEDPAQVSTDVPLMEQGVDSLMIVEMRNKFNREAKTTLPMTLLFNYPTLKKVADYMLAEVLTFPDQGESSDGRPKAGATTDELLQEIETLVKKG